ncbi:MAG: hypothetical protein ABEI54_03070 [Candidatus Bipolaricaulia bacterium]
MSNQDQVQCPTCGSQFEVELSLAACDGCPLANCCGRKKCPYCGTEFVPDLNLLELSEESR